MSDVQQPVPEGPRNIAAKTLLAVIGGMLGIGGIVVWNLVAPEPEPCPTHVRTELAAGIPGDPLPAPNKRWFGIVRGPSEAWSAFAPLCQPEGSPGLALAAVSFYEPPECEGADAGVFDDAGVDLCAINEAQLLPAGIEYNPADEWVESLVLTPDAGPPARLEVWEVSDPGAPWLCACGATTRPDAGACERLVPVGEAFDWRLATPDDMGMRPGQWRGGCARHPCGTWGGGRDWYPPACCADECTGKACGVGKCGSSCGSCEPQQLDGGTLPTVCLGHQCVPDCLPEWKCGPGKIQIDPGTCGTCPTGDSCEDHRCVAPPAAPEAPLEPDASET